MCVRVCVCVEGEERGEGKRRKFTIVVKELSFLSFLRLVLVVPSERLFGDKKADDLWRFDLRRDARGRERWR